MELCLRRKNSVRVVEHMSFMLSVCATLLFLCGCKHKRKAGNAFKMCAKCGANICDATVHAAVFLGRCNHVILLKWAVVELCMMFKNMIGYSLSKSHDNEER